MFIFDLLRGFNSSAKLNFSTYTEVQKESQATFQQLLAADSGIEREAELDTLGKKVLEKGKSWPSVNWRQFALMHNSSIIRHTSFEGGEFGVSLRAWDFFQDLFKKGEALFFKFSIETEVLIELHDIYHDMSDFYSLAPSLRDSPLSEYEVLNCAIDFVNLIKHKLSKKKVVYVPLGYRHGVAGEGHSIVCKVVGKKDTISLSPLHLGDGSEIHPVLDYTTTQEKISIRYFPARLAKNQFFGAFGHAAFCHLLRYEADPPDPELPHYKGLDIVDIFLTLGTLEPYLGPHPETLQAKGQRSGTCPEKAVKNVTHDVFIDRKVNAEESKKFFLNLYFCSLIAGYHSYVNDPSRINAELLRNASEEMGLTDLKLKETLSSDEILAAQAAIHVILKETKNHIPLAKLVSPSNTKHTSQTIKDITSNFPALKIKPPDIVSQQNTTQKIPQTHNRFKMPTLDFKNFNAQLQGWVAFIKTLKEEERFKFLYECTLLLPIPQWHTEVAPSSSDVWNQIEATSIENILSTLQEFLYEGLKETTVSSNFDRLEVSFFEQVLAVHTLYVIADKLARRLDKTKLKGFAAPFFPFLYELEPTQFTSIPLGNENHRYSKIIAYFTKSQKEAEGGVIFPVKPILSVEKYVKDRSLQKKTQGTAHIRYLEQFLLKNFPKASNLVLTNPFIELWKDEKGLLPKPTHVLYYFAFISHLLFCGPHSPFPKTLTFQIGEDRFGKKALIIDGQEKQMFEKHPSVLKKKEHELFEGRFNEMCVETEQLFFSLFSKRYRSLKTNDAVCARLNEKKAENYGISEVLYRDLLRITRKDNLKAPLAIFWASSNLMHLQHPMVQKVLDHCFFAPSGMLERLENEPIIIDAFRSFVQKGLDFYRNNIHHFQAIAFLLKNALFFETHVSALYGNDKANPQLLKYLDTLQHLLSKELTPEQKKKLTSLWLFIQTQIQPKKAREVACVIAEIFNFRSESYKWFTKKISRQNTRYLLGLEKSFKDPSFRDEVCSHLLAAFLPEGAIFRSLTWEGAFPIFKTDGYEIDLLKKSISHFEKGTLLKIDEDFWQSNHWKELQAFGFEFWKNENGQYVSKDENLKFQFGTEGTNLSFDRCILFGGKKRWFRLYAFSVPKIDRINLNFLNYNDLIPLTHYQPLTKEKDDPEILTYQKATNTPYFRIDRNHNSLEITRVDEFGNPLPIKLANLTHINKKDPLYAYTTRIALPEQIICFVNTKTKEVEELNFFHLKLQFKRTLNGLESIQYPGFYFLAHEKVKELNHYEGALVLQNEKGLRKIIVPAKKLRISAEDFSKEVFPAKDMVCYREPFYIFSINPIGGALENEKSSANLYLALLFKMQRDYQSAYRYLAYAKKDTFFDENDFAILESFTHLKDMSPQALALEAKLFFSIVDNMNLMLEQTFSKETEWRFSPYRKLFRWGAAVYKNYLRTISREDLSAIAKTLRLNFQQERALLLALKRYYLKENQKFPDVLQNRFQLICTRERTLKGTIPSKKVSRRPPIFEELREPNRIRISPLSETKEFPLGKNRIKNGHSWQTFTLEAFPNRISHEAVEAHFPELFEKAKNCKTEKDPFDFTLLALLKVKPGCMVSGIPEGSDLAELLFYVRHFSDLFCDLSLEKAKDDLESVKIFNEIIERFSKLQSNPRYLEFKKTFLDEQVDFNYQKKVHIPLSSTSETVSSAFEVKENPHKETAPFRKFLTPLFKKEIRKVTLPQNPPFVDETLKFEPGTLEEQIFQKMQTGYELLKNRETTNYHFQKEHLEKVKEDLEQQNLSLKETVSKKRTAITKKANASFKVASGKLEKEDLQKELDFSLAKDSLQTFKLTPENIMKEAILKNDPTFLARHSPLLKKQEIDELFHAVNDYYHSLVLLKLTEEAIGLIEKLEKNPDEKQAQEDLAALLDYEFLYDEQKFPEISYFKVTAGKLPRRKQVEIYKWVAEGIEKKENRLFQLSAGEGKTSYLIPLLMLRAQREKLMPVVFSTRAIYPVDKDNLASTLAKLAEKISFLEVGLHMKVSEEDLKFIYDELRRYHAEGRGLLITPQIFYALHLMYRYAALKEKNEIKVKWLGLILDFFQTKCLQLMDEEHKNLDALTRSIYGVGEPFFVPEEERELFLEMMKPLLGVTEVTCETGESLSKLSMLRENLLGSPSSEDLVLIQKTLAQLLCNSPLLEIPEKDHESFIRYWTDKKTAQPELLKTLAVKEKKRADLLSIVGYFISDLLKQIVKMRTEFDHAPSIFPGEEFDTPCDHTTASTAQFEDCYRALAASIKGTVHRHLSSIQVRKLIEKLVETDWREQSQTISDIETSSSERFRSWISKASDKKISELHLRDVSLSNASQMQMLTDFLSKHQPAIEYYLSTTILPQVGFCPEQLVATPTDLIHAFLSVIAFSGTPLHKLAHPQVLQTLNLDPVFEAEVVTEYCKEENQHFSFPESVSGFFNEMKEKNPELKKARAFIDPGGFFCDFSNEAVAKMWLDANPDLDGVLYFKDAKTLSVDRDEKICLIMRDGRYFEFYGSEIKTAFEKAHLDWEKLDLGTYYDAGHTESANVVQKKKTRGLLFGGKALTSSRLIQALKRLRGFCDEKSAQTIAWVFQKDLAKKIPTGKEGKLNGPALFYWSVKNEAEEMKKKIILSAFHDIAYYIEAIAMKEIKQYLNDPKMQIALFAKYFEGFVEILKHDPYAAFSNRGEEKETGEVLWAYAKHMYEKFGYDLAFESQGVLQKELTEVVEEIKTVIKTIDTNYSKNVAREVEQHCKIKRETEQIQFCPRKFDPLSAEGIYGNLKISDPGYPMLHTPKPSREVFKTQGLTENLYFEKNQLLTAKNSGVSLEENFLKPVDFFLIILYKGKFWAEVISNEIISHYLKELMECPIDARIEHQAFLVTADGTPVQKGAGSLKPSEEDFKKILTSEWLQDLVIDASVLRGQPRALSRLKERVRDWPDFKEFWKRVVDALPNPENANQKAISTLFAELKSEEKS